MTNTLSLVKSLFLILTTIGSIKEIASSKIIIGDEVVFDNGSNLKVTFKEKKEEDGICKQIIQITYPSGKIHNDVQIKCVEDLSEVDDRTGEDNAWMIGNVVYSNDPKRVLVITPKDLCRWYIDNAKGEPEKKPERKQCNDYKNKLGAGKGGKGGAGGTMDSLANPCGLSGICSKAG